MNDFFALAARILLALIFLISGYGKVVGYASAQQYMQAMGVSGALLPLVIFAELGGGVAVVTGFLTRLAAWGLAIFCVLSAAIFHTKFGDQVQAIMFMKNLAMTGGFIMLAVHGAGGLSVDGWLARRRHGATR